MTQTKQNQKRTLTTVENKIHDASNLATKAALTAVDDKIPNISNLVKKSDYDTKITSIESHVNKLQAIDLSCSTGKQYFEEEDGKQNYLVFLPMPKSFKLSSVVGVIDRVLSWQSKGVYNESIRPPATPKPPTT